MKPSRTILLAGLAGFFATLAHAAEIAGPWHAEFESPRGRQQIQFEFKADGDKLGGKTISRFGGGSRESEIQDGKIEGETLSFVQVMNFQGNEIDKKAEPTTRPTGRVLYTTSR